MFLYWMRSNLRLMHDECEYPKKRSALLSLQLPNGSQNQEFYRILFFHASDFITFPPFSVGGISRPDDSLCSIGMGMSSLPQSWSTFVCSWSCRMPRLDTKPATAMPSTTCQTTLSAFRLAFHRFPKLFGEFCNIQPFDPL
jgi:hypothetical protein